jgi:hypothetical protein
MSDGGLLDSTMNSDEEESQLIRMIVEREEEEESGVLNDAKDHLEKANMSLKVLLVLCRGLKNDSGQPLFDPKREPWRYLKASTLKATSADYKDEVNRRWISFVSKEKAADNSQSTRQPRPKAWRMEDLFEWLDKHPISGEHEVLYLKDAVANHEKVANDSIEAAKAEAEMLETKRWQGEVPYLRLIHCIIDNDNIKLAFLKRHDISSSRMVVENRNSVAKREKTVWELVSEKWNDIDFSYETACIGLHSDFSTSKFQFHTDVENMMVATPEKCEQKFQSMMSELNKRIEKWERSGQGDGGEQAFEDYDDEDGDIRVPSSEGYGILKGRDQGALDKIHAFFEYNQSYLIYLWYMVESHGLLGSSLQRLSEDIGATNGSSGVPSVFEIDVDVEEERSTASTNGGQSTGLDSSISGFGKFGLEAARIEAQQHEKNRLARLQTASIDADQQEKNRLHERAENLRNRIHSLQLEKRKLGLERVDTVPEKKSKLDFLSQEIDELTMDIKQKEEELESILRTPPRNNRTPESAK